MNETPKGIIDSHPITNKIQRDNEYYILKREVEEFLYDEADLLDARKYREWLETLDEDLVYFMPMLFNVKFGEQAEHEKTKIEKDMSWFNEGKWTLTKRVEQVLTGVHWSEEPLSRVCHLVSNIQLDSIDKSPKGYIEVGVRSRFLIYQNRCEIEEYSFIGNRYDVLRKVNDIWKLARREINIHQNVLLAKTLSVFF